MSDANKDTDVTTQDTNMPAPPKKAKDGEATTQDTNMPSEPALTTMDTNMPAPPALDLDLDNK